MSQITSLIIDTDTLNACLADLPAMISSDLSSENAVQQLRRWSNNFSARVEGVLHDLDDSQTCSA